MKLLKINIGFTLVDDEDYDKLSRYNWSYTHGQGVRKATVKSDKPYIRNSSVILARVVTNCPKDFVVDHKDGDKLNNQKENLRVCKQINNCFNKEKTQSKCSSKYKGVYYDKTNKSWKAEISANNNKICIGTFLTEKDAAIAYNTKAKIVHGEFALLNIIENE